MTASGFNPFKRKRPTRQRNQRKNIVIYTPEQIAKLREAGRLVAQTYSFLQPYIEPGVSTAELDRVAERYIRQRGATPAYKGYGAAPAQDGKPPRAAFPASICVAVNDVIVHGIPSANERLTEGDIIGIDIGARLNGFIGDSCVTFPVGRIDPESRRLLEVTRRCLEIGISQAKPGAAIGDIGHAIAKYVEANGFTVVREYGGHGVGQQLHEELFLFHWGDRGDGLKLEPGMVFTIEPMVNMGGAETIEMRDQWTVRTTDGSRSAQFEHTIAITETGCEVLTLP